MQRTWEGFEPTSAQLLKDLPRQPCLLLFTKWHPWCLAWVANQQGLFASSAARVGSVYASGKKLIAIQFDHIWSQLECSCDCCRMHSRSPHSVFGFLCLRDKCVWQQHAKQNSTETSALLVMGLESSARSCITKSFTSCDVHAETLRWSTRVCI